jgi:hypothetical protein
MGVQMEPEYANGLKHYFISAKASSTASVASFT